MATIDPLIAAQEERKAEARRLFIQSSSDRELLEVIAHEILAMADFVAMASEAMESLSSSPMLGMFGAMVGKK